MKKLVLSFLVIAGLSLTTITNSAAEKPGKICQIKTEDDITVTVSQSGSTLTLTASSDAGMVTIYSESEILWEGPVSNTAAIDITGWATGPKKGKLDPRHGSKVFDFTIVEF